MIQRHFIFAALLLCVGNICSAQSNYHFIIHEALQDTASIPLNDREVYEAIEVWRNYVMTQNDSLLIEKDRNDVALTNHIESQIFSNSFARDAIYFHVLGYTHSGQSFIIENLIRYEYPDWNVNTIVSYFSIGAIKEGNTYKLFFLFDEYLAEMVKTKSKWITYYSAPGATPPKSIIKSANNFCDSVAKAFKLKVNEPFNYIISP